MNRIYEIKYEEKWTGCQDWLPDTDKVLANGDAQKAVDKLRRDRLSAQHKTDKGKLCKCIGFRLTSVQVLAEAP